MAEENQNRAMTDNVESQPMEFDTDQFRNLEVGQIIDAKVILVRDDEVYVDIGSKSDMVISLKELTDQSVTSAKEVVAKGDLIKVMVVKAGGEDGVQLSKRRLDMEQIWNELAQDFAESTTLTGTVLSVIKGGLSVKVKGIKAFMPASHSTLTFQANLDELVGQDLSVRIIELDTTKRRLVVSRKVLLEEAKQQAEIAFFQKIAEGEHLEGTVSRITNFGAFVHLGSGIEGLIHISELSWNRVKTVQEVVKVGDAVTVLVISVDVEHKKIGLSLKQLKSHPWLEAIQNFREGDVYAGTVTRLEPFGAFIRLAPNLEGLAHVSQLSEKRISKPEEVLRIGDEVQAKIIKIDRDHHKVGLSLKQVIQDKEDRETEAYLDRQENQSFTQTLGQFFNK